MPSRVQEFGGTEYGETFHCSDVFELLGKDENETITVKEFVEGDVITYINNNAAVCANSNTAPCMKAEALVHYSHEVSEEKIMLLDLQALGYHLFDPEIASRD